MNEVARAEAEAAESRKRLNETIEQLQDKLTVSGLVDDFIGQVAAPKLMDGGQDVLQGIVRRHPVPFILAAVGLGIVIHQLKKRSGQSPTKQIDVPAMNTGKARLYDPDGISRHPIADGADVKRIEA